MVVVESFGGWGVDGVAAVGAVDGDGCDAVLGGGEDCVCHFVDGLLNCLDCRLVFESKSFMVNTSLGLCVGPR
jgi:hypothetical protein